MRLPTIFTRSERGVAPRAAWLAVAGYWALIFGLQKFDHAGVIRGGLLVAAVALTIHLAARAQSGPEARPGTPAGLMAGCALAFALAQTVYFLLKVRHPRLLDIAISTLDAGREMLGGGNPFGAALDPMGAAVAGPAYSGYKYLPVTPAAYMPLGIPYGAPGVIVTNFLLQAGTAWLVYGIARESGGKRAGAFAAILYLSVPLVPFQIFAKGVIELVPVFFLLLALPSTRRNPFLAGLAAGLSLSAKLFPAGAALPALLPEDRHWRFAAGLGLGLLPSLAYFALAPHPFLSNIVEFNAIRPVDDTSWLYGLPNWVRPAASALFLLSWVGAALTVWWKRPPPTVRIGIAIALIIFAILIGPAMHQNYQLWWIPLLSILVALGTGPAPASLALARPGNEATPGLRGRRG